MRLTRRFFPTALPLWPASPRSTIRGLVTRRHPMGNRDNLFVELQTPDGLNCDDIWFVGARLHHLARNHQPRRADGFTLARLRRLALKMNLRRL